MGFFKDLKQLSDTGKQMQRDAGIPTGFGGLRQMTAQANQTLQGVQQSNVDAERLMATGTPAVGTVQGIRDTGTMVNMHPQVEFDLEVSVPGQSPHRLTHRQVVSPVNLPSLQPGMPVSLRVDPMDVNQVLILGA